MSRSTNKQSTSARDPLKGAPRLLARKVRLAQAMIGFERIWRALLWPFAVAGSFLLLTLGEVWSLLPALTHNAGLVGFAIALVASLVPLARVPWSSREEGLRRLEQVSGVKHRPATSFEDKIGEDAGPEQRAVGPRHHDNPCDPLSGAHPGGDVFLAILGLPRLCPAKGSTEGFESRHAGILRRRRTAKKTAHGNRKTHYG